MSDHPYSQPVDELRGAAQTLREGNTWVGRGLAGPLADLLDAAADDATGREPAALGEMPVVVRALTVAGVVTGHPSLFLAGVTQGAPGAGQVAGANGTQEERAG
jgi:hypothetical protein